MIDDPESGRPRSAAPPASNELIPSPEGLDTDNAARPSSMMTPDLEREVADAFASMSAEDKTALSAGTMDGESLPPGSSLTGTVVGVTDDDVFLQFDAKLQGVVPRNQFGKKEAVEPGRKVDVVLERYESDSGLLLVSRQGAVQRALWTTLSVGSIVQGRVTGVIKGGLEIDCQGIRAFMPGSHADLAPMKDVSLLLNQQVRCEVIEIQRRSKNLLVSRRKLMEREREAAKDQLVAELAVGQTRRGVVKNITDFGAFVDIGGIEGLVHIRDLSWGTVEKVSDVVSTGQEIDVVVLKIDTKRERLSLGYKQALPDPWTKVGARYSEGMNVQAKVVRLADFGAFAELEPGVEGLIPLSEMGWSRVHRASDAVTVGQVVDAVIIRTEPEKRRLALSLKQARPDPWQGVLEGFTPNTITPGKVTRIADFGVFVEVAPGVEGLIHISELSDKRVRTCGDVVSVGQEVQARILSVDLEQRRISLSLKPSPESRGDAVVSASAPGSAKKQRKRPLRGGLSSHFEW
jgi:small subunit ribosomal protein S1